MKKNNPMTLLEFFKFVYADGTGCWMWLGALTHGGYGRLYLTCQKEVRAHRWIYERLIGPIPEGLIPDHQCNRPGCVNPWHLKPATPRENVTREGSQSFAAINLRKTNCPYGHPFAGENLFMEGSRRRCRTCNNKRKLAYYHRVAKFRVKKEVVPGAVSTT
jgi:hypothetical protein